MSLSVSVDLLVVGGDGEPVWSGRLPGIPAEGTILDVGLGHGPRFAVTGPVELRLKDYRFGGRGREHEVAVALVPVVRFLIDS